MTVNIVVPELGESIVEATVSHWLKEPGERVAAGEAVVELETEKVNLEVGAERAGVLANIARQAGEDVKIGDVLGMIEEGEGEGEARRPSAPTRVEEGVNAPAAETTARSEEERATPVARRLAEERGVDLSQVAATGASGRVTKQDVEQFLAGQPATDAAPAAAEPRDAPATRAAPTAAPAPPARGAEGEARQDRREERVRLSRRRKTIARRLVEAQRTAAMLTTFNEIDLGAVIEIRKRRKESFKERHAVGLGFMSFFVKASIGALKAFPPVNAALDEDELVLKHYYDIGVAIGAEDGLVVPVLRDADRMSFAEIEQGIEALVKRAQDRSLALEDLRGGTFTITNGGVFGSLLSTPILNPPQVGILGLHKIEERPVARNGEIVIRPMMYVALSYDHRVVDGREAVQFLVRVKELIEEPERIMLEG